MKFAICTFFEGYYDYGVAFDLSSSMRGILLIGMFAPIVPSLINVIVGLRVFQLAKNLNSKVAT